MWAHKKLSFSHPVSNRNISQIKKKKKRKHTHTRTLRIRRNYEHSKRRDLLTKRHSIKCQNIWNFRYCASWNIPCRVKFCLMYILLFSSILIIFSRIKFDVWHLQFPPCEVYTEYNTVKIVFIIHLNLILKRSW